jgi:hypothetical protein
MATRSTFFALAALAVIGTATATTADATQGFRGSYYDDAPHQPPSYSRPSYGGGMHRPGSMNPWPNGGVKPWPNKRCYGHGCNWHRPYPAHRPGYSQPGQAAPAYAPARPIRPYVAPPAPAINPPAPAINPNAAPAAAAPVANNCSCLRKEYTQDNQVIVMRDVCTNEVLSAPVSMPKQPEQPTPPPER